MMHVEMVSTVERHCNGQMFYCYCPAGLSVVALRRLNVGQITRDTCEARDLQLARENGAVSRRYDITTGLTIGARDRSHQCTHALCHRTMKRHARGVAPRAMQFRGQDFASSERPVKKMGKHGGCGPMSFYH